MAIKGDRSDVETSGLRAASFIRLGRSLALLALDGASLFTGRSSLCRKVICFSRGGEFSSRTFLEQNRRLFEDMESLRSLGDVCGLAAVDRRPTISLNGDWHTIVDPYGSGLYTFHGDLRADGYFMNGKQAPGGEPVIRFPKVAGLQVPGDWDTQRESLFFYEGPLWYQRDFWYQTQTPNAGVHSCGCGELPLLRLVQ